MNKILQISDIPRQKITLALPNGSSFSLSIYFSTRQIGWFIDELIYESVTIKGVRISNSPNMLYQFSNKLPFGIACFSDQDLEPVIQTAFLNGTSNLYLLTAAEVASYGAYVVS